MKKNLLLFAVCGISLAAQAQIPVTGLNAHWPFDGNANDVSGNNNNGTVFSATPANDRFGNPNKAYAFNGTTSHIDVPNSTTIDMPNTQNFSISFWVKYRTNSSDIQIMAKHLNGSFNGYFFFAKSTNLGYCNSPGSMSYYIASGAQGDACANSPIANDTTNWYFITGIHNAQLNTTQLYVNSVLQNDVGSKTGSSSNTADLQFGAVKNGNIYTNFFNGYLDGVRIYNRILTQAEVNSLYNEPNPTVDISELSLNTNLFSVAPNPASNELTIQTSEIVKNNLDQPIVLSIYSLDGKLVKSETISVNQLNTNIKISISELKTSLYNINLRSGNYTQNVKFIKE